MTYNVYGTILEDPELIINDFARNMSEKMTKADIILIGTNGEAAPFILSDSLQPTEYTDQGIYVWIWDMLNKKFLV